ncbi:glutathione S-transferase family protein [Vreelandella olivaria]|uniref:glutathione S-transferase family protein n=1 Tax=Vreelandella olivaria TaxID=390919 RepID=UPI00201F38A4|nr:glutathione S-transferase family protein [Halomonas olivaria]
MLVNGIWQENWHPVQAKDEEGRFIRQSSSFRHWITPDGSPGVTGQGGFKAEKGRYHLYVAYICPWASRTLMVRQLKGLTDLISVTVVNPRLSDNGWQFGGYPGADEDRLNGARYLHELYSQADPTYTGRATVPVLWDKKTHTIVNNESADILRMLNSAFEEFGQPGPNLYPADLADEIDALNEVIYRNLNNGVYQAGFASTQLAYEEAYHKVFLTLDELEKRLSDGRSYLFGEQLTETDVRLFVTLIRFDAAYHGLFKCNRNTLKAMPHLHAYMHRIKAINGIADTVNIEHIKAGYYSIKALNPSGIVPVGPASL